MRKITAKTDFIKTVFEILRKAVCEVDILSDLILSHVEPTVRIFPFF